MHSVEVIITDTTAIRQKIIAAVRAKGFRVQGISIEVAEGQVRLSGEVESYYAVQMTQLASRVICPNHRIITDLRVILDNSESDRRPFNDSRTTEVYGIRNCLNELTTGLHLLQRLLHDGNVAEAQTLVEKLTARYPHRERIDS